jgi:hypothetical protein
LSKIGEKLHNVRTGELSCPVCVPYHGGVDNITNMKYNAYGCQYMLQYWGTAAELLSAVGICISNIYIYIYIINTREGYFLNFELY